MADELKLTLPERGKKGSRFSKAVPMLLLVVLVVGVLNLYLLTVKYLPVSERSSGAELSPDEVKNLALKLEKQQLRAAAVEAWKEYLKGAKAPGAERAKIWYRIGKLEQSAGNYERALNAFYRSEALGRVKELAPEISRRVGQCLESLGKFAALRYELEERTGVEKGSPAGEEVVAEIGAWKITKARLDGLIEEQIDMQLSRLGAYLSPGQIKRQKEAMLKRFSSNKARLQLLNQIIAEEILSRRARELKLAEEPAVRNYLKDVEKKILAQKLIEKETREKINITEGDLKTYYEANKKKYMQKERARISHILVGDEKTAAELLKKIKAGGSFEELAKKYSTDKATKEKGGRIESWANKGSYIPGIGNAPEASAVIFSTEEGAVAEKFVKTDKGFHIIKVRKRQGELQKSFDEVKQEVQRALQSQKEQEVQRELIEGLKERYNVVIHFSGFEAEKPAEKNEAKK